MRVGDASERKWCPLWYKKRSNGSLRVRLVHQMRRSAEVAGKQYYVYERWSLTNPQVSYSSFQT